MDNTIFNKFQAFELSQLFNAVNVLRVLKKSEVSIDDFLKTIDEKMKEKEKQIKEEGEKVRKLYEKEFKSFARKEKPPVPKTENKKNPKTLSCPKCAEVAYVQSVCPNCAKGKAGIKSQYICGDCNFVFYI